MLCHCGSILQHCNIAVNRFHSECASTNNLTHFEKHFSLKSHPLFQSSQLFFHESHKLGKTRPVDRIKHPAATHYLVTKQTQTRFKCYPPVCYTNIIVVLTQILQHNRVAPCDIHFQSFCRMRHSQLYQDMGWLLIVSTKYVHNEKPFIGIVLAQYKLKPVYGSERERDRDLEKRFPIAKCRRPRRHSALYKPLWKYSQVPSTSRANAPAKMSCKNNKSAKNKDQSHQDYHLHTQYLHFLLQRSWNHVQCLLRGQSHRSSPVCRVSPKHFWLLSPCGYTVGKKLFTKTFFTQTI